MVRINDCEHRVAVYGFASSSTARRVSLLRHISGHFRPSRRVSPRQKHRPWLLSLPSPAAAQVEQRELPSYSSWLEHNGRDRELQYRRGSIRQKPSTFAVFTFCFALLGVTSRVLRIGTH